NDALRIWIYGWNRNIIFFQVALRRPRKEVITHHHHDLLACTHTHTHTHTLALPIHNTPICTKDTRVHTHTDTHTHMHALVSYTTRAYVRETHVGTHTQTHTHTCTYCILHHFKYFDNSTKNT